MVMLDIFAGTTADLVVASFDHGTRPSSKDDVNFVEQRSKDYNLAYVSKQVELGPEASEAEARSERYDFLSHITDDYVIYTAHHLDDLIESVVINFIRGTGWRGLAVLDTPNIRRPFLEPEFLPENVRNQAPFDKKRIYRYAGEQELHLREDPTNSDDEYLRNRLRHQMNNVQIPYAKKLQFYELWQKQKAVKKQIDQLLSELIPKAGEKWQRKWFLGLEPETAIELLRAGTRQAGIEATRPQLEDFRQAILNYAPGKYFNLPNDYLIKLGKDDFLLEAKAPN